MRPPPRCRPGAGSRCSTRCGADSGATRVQRTQPGCHPGSGDVTTTVGPFTATLVAAMAWAYRYSDTLVDAAVLDRVIAAGYDADFDEVVARGARTSGPAGRPAHSASGRCHRRQPGAQTCRDSVGFGWRWQGACRRPAGRVGCGRLAPRASWSTWAGDIRAVGVDLDGPPWRIGIADERAALSPGWDIGRLPGGVDHPRRGRGDK